jgi:hypothetical protein
LSKKLKSGSFRPANVLPAVISIQAPELASEYA